MGTLIAAGAKHGLNRMEGKAFEATGTLLIIHKEMTDNIPRTSTVSMNIQQLDVLVNVLNKLKAKLEENTALIPANLRFDREAYKTKRQEEEIARTYENNPMFKAMLDNAVRQ